MEERYQHLLNAHQSLLEVVIIDAAEFRFIVWMLNALMALSAVLLGWIIYKIYRHLADNSGYRTIKPLEFGAIFMSIASILFCASLSRAVQTLPTQAASALTAARSEQANACNNLLNTIRFDPQPMEHTTKTTIASICGTHALEDAIGIPSP